MPEFMVSVQFEGVVAVKAASKKAAQNKAAEMNFRDFDNIEVLGAEAQPIPPGFIDASYWRNR